eukprot:1161685-Pelagomonas_calceolata.AAC.2
MRQANCCFTKLISWAFQRNKDKKCGRPTAASLCSISKNSQRIRDNKCGRPPAASLSSCSRA